MKNRTEKNRKATVLTIAAIVVVIIAVVAGIFVFASDGENRLETVYSLEAESPYFKAIEMTVISAGEGYSTDSPDRTNVELKFRFTLDDGALWEKSEEISAYGFPVRGNMSDEEWVQTMRDWFAANSDIPGVNEPVEFRHSIVDETVELITCHDVTDVPIVCDTGTQIGTFNIIDNEMYVRFDPIVYFMSNVYFEFNAVAQVKTRELPAGTYEVVVGEKGGLEIENYGKWDADHPKDKPSDYEIAKSGPSDTEDTNVEYTITVSANNGESLAGKQMKEDVPAGMEIVRAQVALNGGAKADILSEMTDNVYTFPEDDTLTSAVFTVMLSLSDDKLLEYYQNGLTETFKNKAELRVPDTSEPLAVSNEVATTVNASLVRKVGKATNAEETEFEWKVYFSTSLPYLDYGYLIDRLPADDHFYDFSKGISVRTEDGVYRIEPENILPMPDYNAQWNDLRAEDINASGIDKHFFDIPHAYYYYVDTDEANIFSQSDMRVAKRDCYLVIPFYGLQGGAYESKKVTITYYTNLNMHGLSAAEYWTCLENFANSADFDEYAPNIHNDVILLWKNIEGNEGVEGDIVPEMVDYGKDYDIDPAIIVKKGRSYDPKTMTANWQIEVDKLGFAVDDVTVTDILSPEVYDLESLELTLTKQHADDHSEISSEELRRGKGYTVADDGTVKIALGDIPEGVFSVIDIKAKVISTELLSRQSNSQSISNTARIDYVINDKPRYFSAQDDLTIPNTLIAKSPVGKYDKENGTFTWNIVFGKDGLKLDNSTVTDYIPEGFEYVEGSAVLSPSDIRLLVSRGSNGTVIFKPDGSINKQYSLTLKTAATQQWIDKNLIYTEDHTEDVTVVNTAILDGTYKGVPVKDKNGNTGIAVFAENSAPVTPIGKSGIYVKEENKIKWTVTLNDVHYTLDDMTFVEELDSALELATGTVRITPDTGYEILESSDSALRLKFTGSGNTNAYTISFDTLLTCDAIGAKIRNRIYTYASDGSRLSMSLESDGGYDGSYDPDYDSNAHLRPNLHIHKISSNSSEATDREKMNDGNSLSLANAQFSLDAYEYTLENGVLSLTDIVPRYSGRERSTDGNGNAYFGNLKTTNDNGRPLIFILRETKAPTGYVVSRDAMKLVCFQKNADDIGTVHDMSTVTTIHYYDGGAKATVENDAAKSLLLVQKAQSSGGWLTLDGYFENAPDANICSIQKKNLVWDSFKTGEKTYEKSGAGIVFKAKLEGSDKLREFTAVTNEDGVATFEDLDPGTYTVTESNAHYGMLAGSFELKVECIDAQANEWKYTLSEAPDSLVKIISDESGVYVANDAQLTDLTLSKYEKYSDGAAETQPLKGVKYRIVSVTPKDSRAVNADYIKYTSAASDQNGTICFPELPVGSYEISEVVDTAAGYEAGIGSDILIYRLDITQQVRQDGSTELVKTLTPADTTGKVTYSDDGYTVYNIPVRGTFIAHKVSSSAIIGTLNNEPLEGAVFQLMRRTTSGTKKAYEATSDEDGNIVFTDVEYGDYTLKEVSTPTGYDLMSSMLVCYKTSLTLTKDKQSFNLDYNSAKLKNTLHNATVTLLKINDDNGAMSGVDFVVYRRGLNAVEPDGTGYEITVNSGVDTYYSFMDERVTTDENGNLSVKLPYGDYLLVEDTTGLDLKTDYANVAVLVKVAASSTSATMYSSGTALDYDESGECYTVENTSSGMWSKLTAKVKNNYTVLNKLRFGYIQLKKLAADIGRDGSVTVYDSYPLSGRVFEILRDGEVYAEVTTDAQGNITRNGDTYSGRHLWYGTYTLREKTDSLAYSYTVPEIEFTVDDTTVGDGGTVWLSYGGESADAPKYIAPGGSVTGKPFVNFLARSAFFVMKKGDDGSVPTGAKFELYAGNRKIADFTEGENGVYTLVSCGEKDSHGVPYIIDGDRLLKGVYTLRETKAPVGYLLADDVTVEVTGNETFTVSMARGSTGSAVKNGSAAEITDVQIRRDVTINKVYSDNGKKIPNIVFELYRDTGRGTEPVLKNGSIVTVTTGAAGAATFEALTEGDYVIKESLEKSVAAGAADDVCIDTERNVRVHVAADETGKECLLYVDDNLVLPGVGTKIENERMNVTVKLAKADGEDAEVMLRAVKFLLEKKNGSDYAAYTANGGSGVYATNAAGEITISGLVRGSYRLRETETLDGYTLGDGFAAVFDITCAQNGKTLTVKSGEDWFTAASGAGLLTEKGVKNERIYGEMTLVKKQDSKDGAGLDGAVFTLTRKSDGRKFNLVSGYSYASPEDTSPVKAESGRLTVKDLPWGEYELQETACVRGYSFDADKKYTFELGRIDGKAKLKKDIGTIINVCNEMTITKRAAQTGTPLAGAVFEIVDTADSTDRVTVTTGEDGKAMVRRMLTGGQTYTVKETQAPKGYRLSDETVTFTMGMDGKLYIDSKAADNELLFTDEILTGTVTFMKSISYPGFAEIDSKPLAGAKFVLRAASDGKELTASSGADGRVIFNDVPYGDYVLYETEAPAGFKSVEGAVMSISSSDFKVVGNTFTADYTQKPVKNAIEENTLRIVKTEKHDGAMADVTFDVYRRGSKNVTENGGGFVTAAAADINTYHRYMPCSTLVTGADGKAQAVLPYGDYMLVERTGGMGLLDTADCVALLAHVTGDGVTAKLYVSGTDIEKHGGAYIAADGWSSIEQTNGAFVIENERKHILIDLKKMAGGIGRDGRSICYAGAPLGGVEFTVTEKGASEPLFTVTTDENGRIKPDANGETYSGKYIRCGEYVLEEKGTEIACEFTVGQNVRNGEVFWFSHDGAGVTCTPGAEGENRAAFINVISRFDISVKKADKFSTYKKLENAVFELYSKDTESRAALLKSGEGGQCVISDCDAKNSLNIPYCTEGRLLPGEYILKEISAPDGYLSAPDIAFTVSENGTLSAYSSFAEVSGSELMVYDIKIGGDIALRKLYAREDVSGSDAEEKPIKNLVFMLCDKSGVPMKDSSDMLITAKTDSEGFAAFKDLPKGEYVVRENLQYSVAAGITDDVYIDPNKEIRVRICANDDGQQPVVQEILEDGKAVTVKDHITVEDMTMETVIRLGMTDGETDKPMKGVEFRLDKLVPGVDPTFTPVGKYATDSDGEMSIDILSRGTFILSQTSEIEECGFEEPVAISFELAYEKPGTVMEVLGSEDWFTAISGAQYISEHGIVTGKLDTGVNKNTGGSSAQTNINKQPAAGIDQPNDMGVYTGNVGDYANYQYDNSGYGLSDSGSPIIITGNGDTPDYSNKDQAVFTPTTGETEKETPQTGDDTNNEILIVVFNASLLILVLLVIRRRKHAAQSK